MAARTKGKSSFVKQAAILASAGMLVRFLGFVYRLPLTNMLGDEGNGIYGMGYYIYTFLLILSSAGLPAAISKLVSERLALRQYRNAHRVFQTSLIVSASLGTIFAILMALTARQTAALVKTPDSYYCIFVPLSNTDYRCHYVCLPWLFPRHEYHGAHSHFSDCGTDF